MFGGGRIHVCIPGMLTHFIALRGRRVGGSRRDKQEQTVTMRLGADATAIPTPISHLKANAHNADTEHHFRAPPGFPMGPQTTHLCLRLPRSPPPNRYIIPHGDHGGSSCPALPCLMTDLDDFSKTMGEFTIKRATKLESAQIVIHHCILCVPEFPGTSCFRNSVA